MVGQETKVELQLRRDRLNMKEVTESIAKLGSKPSRVIIASHGSPAASLSTKEAPGMLRRRVAILEGIARGECALEEGRLLTHAEAKNRMARWLNRVPEKSGE